MTPSAHDIMRHLTGPRRRGTILVFVLGILTLLALVGLVLITRTHGEARRVALDSDAQSSRSTMNGIVRGVQETLWRDIWGPAPDPIHPMPLDSNKDRLSAAPATIENNEPFDAPGPDDRWLASTVPYMQYDLNPASPTYGLPLQVATYKGNPPPPPYPQFESEVLAWKYVSYLGVDLLAPEGQMSGSQPFAWAVDSRIYPPPVIAPPVFYDPVSLSDVPILQTPPPGAFATGAPMIRGSTTNVTIAEARERWFAPGHQAQLAAVFPDPDIQVPRFPYFDTNADGILDLYDADGDGVPDSPLSFVIPVDSSDPSAPKQLYAAVRIVDHGSMLNVNVASGMGYPSGNAVFDESLAGLQRRGQRPTDLLLDEVVHRRDSFLNSANRTGRTVAYRNNGRFADAWPMAYDDNVVRNLLSGGAQPSTGSLNFALYGMSDEASLRHRGLLVPYARRREYTMTGYTTIDRALPNSLQWTRQVDPANDYTYTGGDSRWTRFNAQWGDPNGFYEGNDPVLTPNVKGWRTLLREDEPYAIRRHMLTTVSHHVEPPPSLHHLLFMNSNPGSFPFSNATQQSGVSDLEFVQQKFRERGMDWPILGAPRFATNPTLSGALAAVTAILPDWARVGRTDLNMGDENNPAGAKQDFIRYAAAAMYAALEGVTSYQGLPLDANTVEGRFNREYFAWQFAVNLADYRDHDDEPTIVEWPPNTGRFIYGVEKQPFFTEAYAHLTAGDPRSSPSPVSRPGDQWFFAVELFVPPHWDIPLDRLFIRSHSPNSAASLMLPLSSFLSVFGSQPPPLNGNGDRGRFIVLCGSTLYAPATVNTNSFYRNTQFSIPTDGNGSVELVYSTTGLLGDATEHVLDVIGPRLAGKAPANDLIELIDNSPGDAWARNPGPPTVSPDDKLEFSLLRSTRGWRFTTAWHIFAMGTPSTGPVPVSRPPTGVRQSLGQPNNTSETLDRFLPESPWPARQLANHVNPAVIGAVPDTFMATEPYRDFDSVADLSRLLIIGALRRQASLDPPYLLDRNGNLMLPGPTPATEVLAQLVARMNVAGSPFDLSSTPSDRIMAGRIDFRSAQVARGRHWSHRLASFFTPRSMMFDGIDNDGNGLADLNDPAEAARVLFRRPGGINVNTAPVRVLRSVPYMTLLPDSPSFVARGFGSGSPADDFFNPSFAERFWDYASSIVARRERRVVPIRLWNVSAQQMQTVTAARRSTDLGRPTATDSGPIQDVLQLANLRQLTGASGDSADPQASLFRIDRFTFRPNNPGLDLYSHQGVAPDPILGPLDLFSPDFWSRRLDTDQDGDFDANQDAWMYENVLRRPVSAGAFDRSTGGMRARDIYLARWTNMLTVRSDVFTAYIALIDEDGNYVQRSQVTLDRSECFRRPPVGGEIRNTILPRILTREDGGYSEAGR